VSYERWEIPGVLKSRVCPRKLIEQSSNEWIALHAHYRAGFLAVAGGVLDQPNAYLEAMRLIDHWIAQDARKS
jgi:hypothetical protein